MIRVVIVATHIEVREGLNSLLRLEGKLDVVGIAANLDSALCLACVERPDVALVDLEIPEGGGYEILRQLQRLCPSTKTIALTAHDYPAARQSAIEAGASKVIVKGLRVSEMVENILE